MAIKTINPKESKFLHDNYHFSQAVRSGELLLCSGQIGTGADGKVPRISRKSSPVHGPK